MFQGFAQVAHPDFEADTRDCRICSGNICYNPGYKIDEVERIVTAKSLIAGKDAVTYAWSATGPRYVPRLTLSIGSNTTTVDVLPTSVRMLYINDECYRTITDFIISEIRRRDLPVPSASRCAYSVFERGNVRHIESVNLRIVSESDKVLAGLVKMTLSARDDAKDPSVGAHRDLLKQKTAEFTKMGPAKFKDTARTMKLIYADIKGFLGIGRSGVVFDVVAHPKEQPKLQQRYAMKLIYGADTKTEVKDEMQVLQDLQGCHGTCVKLEYGKLEGVPTMILEKVPGVSLMKKLGGDLSATSPLAYTTWLVSLINFQLALKDQGVWCPDQHMDNFIVSSSKSDGNVKCIDLGRTEPAPEGEMLAPADFMGDLNLAALKWLEGFLGPLGNRNSWEALTQTVGWCFVLRLVRNIRVESLHMLKNFQGLLPGCDGDHNLNPWLRTDLEVLKKKAEKAAGYLMFAVARARSREDETSDQGAISSSDDDIDMEAYFESRSQGTSQPSSPVSSEYEEDGEGTVADSPVASEADEKDLGDVSPTASIAEEKLMDEEEDALAVTNRRAAPPLPSQFKKLRKGADPAAPPKAAPPPKKVPPKEPQGPHQGHPRVHWAGRGVGLRPLERVEHFHEMHPHPVEGFVENVHHAVEELEERLHHGHRPGQRPRSHTKEHDADVSDRNKGNSLSRKRLKTM